MSSCSAPEGISALGISLLWVSYWLGVKAGLRHHPRQPHFAMLERVLKWKFLAAFAYAAVVLPQSAVQNQNFEGYSAAILSNSKLQLVVMTTGSTLASVTLAD